MHCKAPRNDNESAPAGTSGHKKGLGNLDSTCMDQGKSQEAQKMDRLVLNKLERAIGCEDSDTLPSLSVWAFICQKLHGRNNAAEDYLRISRKI